MLKKLKELNERRKIVFPVGDILKKNLMSVIILKRYSENKDGFFFIQIGSNDGVIVDYLHSYIVKYRWAGICIEPVEHVFKKLKENYKKNKNVHCENVAISDKDGHQDFYQIVQKDGSENSIIEDCFGSFKKYLLIEYTKKKQKQKCQDS